MFTSSIAVFGPMPSGPLPDPTPDDVALHPGTMYGATKVAGELLCAYYRKRYGIDCRGVRFPGLISAAMPGGGSSDYALFMYVDAVRKGGYEAFARADTRIPLMYMPDGVRALLELAFADREKLTRTIYNIAAFSPRAEEIATSVQRALPDARFTYAADPGRQDILDSWPKAIDDSAARRDWNWAPRYDLQAMTDDLLPRIQRMLELGAVLSH
jgi:threonine 3-dehydrogenase